MPSHLRLRRDAELPPLPDPRALMPALTLRDIPAESGETNYLVSFRSPEGGAPIREFVIETLTWGWAALMIAQGILQGVGATIWNKVFGDSTRDFTAFQVQLLERIAALIQAAITQEAKRRVEADLQSLENLFGIYENNRDRLLLQPLLIKASDIVFETASIGLPTVGSYAIVGGLELAVLQEIHTHTHADGDKKNVAQVAIKLWSKVPDFMVMLSNYNSSRFSELVLLPPGSNWAYTVDGQTIVRAGPDLDAARQARGDHIQREYARLEQDILAPLYPVAAKWREIALQYGWAPPPAVGQPQA
ncbi:hypothetical protein [Cupriavidus sp. TMH.W2]|uniref:hypothetical protein n=1 Tax=Cupriavidus sp. TMH.W2 TaxID=3434465 RepID=UPI003D77E962